MPTYRLTDKATGEVIARFTQNAPPSGDQIQEAQRYFYNQKKSAPERVMGAAGSLIGGAYEGGIKPIIQAVMHPRDTANALLGMPNPETGATGVEPAAANLEQDIATVFGGRGGTVGAPGVKAPQMQKIPIVGPMAAGVYTAAKEPLMSLQARRAGDYEGMAGDIGNLAGVIGSLILPARAGRGGAAPTTERLAGGLARRTMGAVAPESVPLEPVAPGSLKTAPPSRVRLRPGTRPDAAFEPAYQEWMRQAEQARAAGQEPPPAPAVEAPGTWDRYINPAGEVPLEKGPPGMLPQRFQGLGDLITNIVRGRAGSGRFPARARYPESAFPEGGGKPAATAPAPAAAEPVALTGATPPEVTPVAPVSAGTVPEPVAPAPKPYAWLKESDAPPGIEKNNTTGSVIVGPDGKSVWISHGDMVKAVAQGGKPAGDVIGREFANQARAEGLHVQPRGKISVGGGKTRTWYTIGQDEAAVQRAIKANTVEAGGEAYGYPPEAIAAMKGQAPAAPVVAPPEAPPAAPEAPAASSATRGATQPAPSAPPAAPAAAAPEPRPGIGPYAHFTDPQLVEAVSSGKKPAAILKTDPGKVQGFVTFKTKGGQYVLAKDVKTAQRIAELDEPTDPGKVTPEGEAELGRLLGYDQASIDAWLEKSGMYTPAAVTRRGFLGKAATGAAGSILSGKEPAGSAAKTRVSPDTVVGKIRGLSENINKVLEDDAVVRVWKQDRGDTNFMVEVMGYLTDENSLSQAPKGVVSALRRSLREIAALDDSPEIGALAESLLEDTKGLTAQELTPMLLRAGKDMLDAYNARNASGGRPPSPPAPPANPPVGGGGPPAGSPPKPPTGGGGTPPGQPPQPPGGGTPPPPAGPPGPPQGPKLELPPAGRVNPNLTIPPNPNVRVVKPLQPFPLGLMTKGEQTGSRARQTLEHTFEASVPGSGPFEKLRSAQQKELVSRYAQDVMDQISTRRSDTETSGIAAQRTAEKFMRKMKAGIYTKVNELAKGVEVDPVVLRNKFDSIRKELTDSKLRVPMGKDTQIMKILDRTINTKGKVSFEDLTDLRSQLIDLRDSGVARKEIPGRHSATMARMINAVDDAAEAAAGSKPGLKEAWRKASGDWRELKRVFNETVVGTILKEKDPSKVHLKLAKASYQDLRTLQDVLGQEQFDTLKAQLVEDMLKRSTIGETTPGVAGAAKRLLMGAETEKLSGVKFRGELEKLGSERLSVLFSPGQLRSLHELAQTAERLGGGRGKASWVGAAINMHLLWTSTKAASAALGGNWWGAGEGVAQVASEAAAIRLMSRVMARQEGPGLLRKYLQAVEKGNKGGPDVLQIPPRTNRAEAQFWGARLGQMMTEEHRKEKEGD